MNDRECPRSGDFEDKMRALQRDYSDKEVEGLGERTLSDYRRMLLIRHNNLRQKHGNRPVLASNVVIRHHSCSASTLLALSNQRQAHRSSDQ